MQSTNSFAGVSYDECFNGLVSDDVSYYTTGIRELSDDVAPYTPQKLVADNVLTSSGSTNCAPAKNAHIEEYIDGMDWEVVYNNGLTVKGYAACGGSKYNAANSPYTWSGTSGTTKIASTYTSCLCSLDANVLEGDDKDNAKWYFAVKPADNSAYTSDYVGKLRNCREVCPQKCAEAFINGTGAVRNALSDINSCDVFQSGNSGGGTTNCGDTQYLDGDTCVDKDDAWCASDTNYGSTYYWNVDTCTPKDDTYCHSIDETYYWDEIEGDCVENYERYCNDVWFDEGYYWDEIANDCVEKDNAYCIATNENKPYYYLDGNDCKINRTMYCQIESGDGYSWNESSGSCQLNLPNCDEATQYLDANNQCVAKDTAYCENNTGANYYWNGNACAEKDDTYCENENGAWYWFWNGNACERDNGLYCEDEYGSNYYWNDANCVMKDTAYCENNTGANYYWNGNACAEKDDTYCENEYGAWYWFWNGNACERYNEFYCEEEFGANYYWDGSDCAVKNNAWCENNSGSNYYWDGSSCAEKNTAWCQNNYGADYEWVNNTCSAWCENNDTYYLDGGVCTEKNTEWCRSYNGINYYWDNNNNECTQIQCAENEIFDFDVAGCVMCEDGTRPNDNNECVGLTNWSCTDGEILDTPNTYFYTSTDMDNNPPASIEELISQNYVVGNSNSTSFYLTNISDALNAYLRNQNWTIKYQNKNITGYGSCFSNKWGDKNATKTIEEGVTVYTNHACACSLDGKNWVGSGLKFANDGKGNTSMSARNAECRRQCPEYCAELIATDADYRTLVFQNVCPSEQVVSIDCGSGKMLYNEQCIPVEFYMTTDVLRNGSYRFTISAAGDFYVNWGDGSDTEYYHFDTPEVRTFEKTMAVDNPTISLSGNATEYLDGYSAVDFSIDNTSSHITGIYGSLGSIFGTITPGSTSGQPMFKETFANCSGIISTIPAELFDGVYGETVESMFDGTFRNTNNISGPLPSNLFANLTGAPAGMIFYRTFEGSGVFNNGNGETPANLFAGFNGDMFASHSAFYMTFANTGVTIVPENLFCYDSDHCLTGVPDEDMFGSTFAGCASLYGIRKTNGTIVDYVPESMFANMSESNIAVITMFDGTQLATSCPANMYKSSSWYNSAEYLGYRLHNEDETPEPIVMCAQCPSGSVSSAGSASIDACQPVSCDIDYYMYTDGNGNVHCEPCASGTHSSGGQSTSCSSGVCENNEYFGAGNGDSTLMCRTCPSGAITDFDTNEDAIEAFPEFNTLYENNIVRQGGNENEYLLTSKDAATVSAYIGEQSWSLTFEDGNTISGYSGCFSNAWGKKNQVKTIKDGIDVFAHHNCACSFDGNRWVGSGFSISYDNRPMSERNNLCRQECPAVCAKLVATDTVYREKMYVSNNICNNESLPVVDCNIETNGIYPNVGGSDISECYASVKFFYSDPLELIDDNSMYYSAEVVYMDDGYTVSSLPTPLHKEGQRFVGWCEGGTDCDEYTITTNFTGLRGNKEYYAIYEEYTEPDTYHCEPGYYLDANAEVCNTLCDENSYCEGGDYNYSNEPQGIEHCPSGLVSPEGTVSADHCGKKLHIGDMVLYMTRVQQTHPALAVRLDGTTYYAKTTLVSSGAKSKLRTKINGIEYSIHDNIMQEVQ